MYHSQAKATNHLIYISAFYKGTIWIYLSIYHSLKPQGFITHFGRMEIGGKSEKMLLVWLNGNIVECTDTFPIYFHQFSFIFLSFSLFFTFTTLSNTFNFHFNSSIFAFTLFHFHPLIFFSLYQMESKRKIKLYYQ